MTADTASQDKTAVHGASERLNHLPLHNAPSMHDLLALKRQRRSFDADAVAEPQQDVAVAASSSQLQPNASIPAPAWGAQTPTADADMRTESVSLLPQMAAFLTSPTFTTPVLPAVPGEPMSGYFQRLRAVPPDLELIRTTSLERDGVYLHKRPIRAPNGASPLAVCGSVMHHVMVLVRQGPLLHTLDFGPANGADVTANILEDARPKKVLATEPAGDVAIATDGQEELPYLYLGPAMYDIDHPLVQQLIDFAESRPYNALRNNCIHFADTLVRVLTAGAVRSAPLLYDMFCGSVPAVDNPMLLMMQIMLRMPWFAVVDGSSFAATFLELCRQKASAAGAVEDQLVIEKETEGGEEEQQQLEPAEDHPKTQIHEIQTRSGYGSGFGSPQETPNSQGVERSSSDSINVEARDIPNNNNNHNHHEAQWKRRGTEMYEEGADVRERQQHQHQEDKRKEEEGDPKDPLPGERGDVVSESRLQPSEEERREEQENDHALYAVVEAVKA